RYLPGVALLVAVAVGARLVGRTVPHANALVVAVAAGIVVANLVDLPDRVEPGVGTHKLWLEAGIVLMGARISVGTLLDAGVRLLALVVAVIVVTVVLVELFGSFLFDIPRKLVSLLAAGAGICGVSAVVGVAGGIRATEEQIAYAAGVVLLFDVATLFLYPVLGSWLHLSDTVFGVWAGLTMFSTGPVTAAGFAVSETAGQWATVTKLTRNLLLGVLVGVYSLVYADWSAEEAFSPSMLWRAFPKFVLGFFAVMLLASSPLLSGAATSELTDAYRWLFLLAFSGLGLSVTVDDLRDTGGRPAVLVLVVLIVVSAASLVAVRTLFGS
ncbi:YeiH family protein, partial [Halobium palmae]